MLSLLCHFSVIHHQDRSKCGLKMVVVDAFCRSEDLQDLRVKEAIQEQLWPYYSFA